MKKLILVIAILFTAKFCAADSAAPVFTVNITDEAVYPSYGVQYTHDFEKFSLTGGFSVGQSTVDETRKLIVYSEDDINLEFPIPVIVSEEPVVSAQDVNVFEFYVTPSYEKQLTEYVSGVIGAGPELVVVEYGETDVLFGGRVFGGVTYNVPYGMDIAVSGGYKLRQGGDFVDVDGWFAEAKLSLDF